MWNKPVLALALLASLVAFGPLAGPASAQSSKKTPQTYVSPPAYYGYSSSSVTPFGMGAYGVTTPYATPYAAPYAAPYFAPAYNYTPLIIPNIPQNNQDVNIYSGSFGNFGVPNGFSSYYLNAYAPAYTMPYAPSVYSIGGPYSTYSPPAYTFGGYNPSSVTPFK